MMREWYNGDRFALDAAGRMLDEEGIEALPFELDVTDRQAMEDAAGRVEESLGRVHLVCNNAGIGVHGPLDQATYDDWDWVMGVNLGGVVNGIQTFLGRMKAHGEGGHFVNTSSMAGLLVDPSMGIYSATKFAVVGLSESLRVGCAPLGIGVSVLCPGLVATNIMEVARHRPPHLADTAASEADADVAAEFAATIRAGQDPIVVAEAVREAVLADEFWILTHPEFKPFIAARTEGILDAFKAEPDPVGVAAIAAMVKRMTEDG